MPMKYLVTPVFRFVMLSRWLQSVQMRCAEVPLPRFCAWTGIAEGHMAPERRATPWPNWCILESDALDSQFTYTTGYG